MTDENPLLNDDERETDQRLRELFDALGQGPGMEEALLDQARLMGLRAGTAYAAIGSNVPMAYFHAGLVYAQTCAPHRHEVDKGKHSAAFYDGFSEKYWANVSDKQKEGPYA